MKPYFDKTLDGLLANTKKNDGGCLVWLGAKGSNGYAHAIIQKKYVVVSRYVLEMTTGEKKDRNTYACHTCDNPSCINPDHLFWGTNKENIVDAQNKNRFPVAQHGTRAKYVSGCRCEDCKKASANYSYSRRHGAK
jgi:hypothetical protein